MMGMALAKSKKAKKRAAKAKAKAKGLPTATSRSKAAVDPGTPETAARLVLPPWSSWDRELQDAVAAIDEAVRLLAGTQLVQAADPGRLFHHAAPEWPAGSREERLVRRFTWWRWQISRKRWMNGYGVGDVIDVICHGLPAWPALPLREAVGAYLDYPRYRPTGLEQRPGWRPCRGTQEGCQ